MYLDYHDIPDGPDEMWHLPERSAQRGISNKHYHFYEKLQNDKLLAKLDWPHHYV